MNYVNHYGQMIERARERVLGGYFERHHVIPKCMGGGNEKSNIVALTPEEHYVAHQLLIRIYPGNGKLAHAAMTMARRCSNNKAFGWIRRRHAAAISAAMTPERKKAISNRFSGVPLTQETRAKLSKAMLGNKNSTGIKTVEHRSNLSKSLTGRVHSLEARLKMSRAHTGVLASAETREKMSAAHRGNRYAAGHSPSAEARAITGARFRGATLADAHKAKISAGLRDYWELRRKTRTP